MSELDDLMAACVATPDDDAPRLVWADAIGGERGELVVIQCTLARGGLPIAEAAALRRRNDELLFAHGLAWSGFEDLKAAQRGVFRRGFLDAIEFDVHAAPWTSVFTRAPLLTSLNAKGLSGRIDYRESDQLDGPDPILWLAGMFERPELARLRALAIDGASLYEVTGDTEWHFHSTSRADELMELIARTGQLAGKRALGFHDTFTPRGMHELLGSNALAELERLAFHYGESDRSQVVELFAAAPKLRALDLHGAFRLRDIADIIPTSIVELSVSGIGNEDLAALAASPVAEHLERLSIAGSNVAANAGCFGAFRNVRSLDLQYTGLDSGYANDDGSTQREAAPKFVATSLPALRELRPFSSSSTETMLAIAEAFGAQLERLDVLGYDGLTCLAELRTKIAGDVLAGPYQQPAPLLVAGVDTREPWIRYGLVTLHR